MGNKIVTGIILCFLIVNIDQLDQEYVPQQINKPAPER